MKSLLLCLFLITGCIVGPIEPTELAFEEKDIPGDELTQAGGSTLLKTSFEQTLFPFTKNNCFSCHSASHGSANSTTALTDIQEMAKVNFASPDQSVLYLKLFQGHQTFSAADAAEILRLINLWKDQAGNDVAGSEDQSTEPNVTYALTTDTKKLFEPSVEDPSSIVITAKDHKSQITLEGDRFVYGVDKGVHFFTAPLPLITVNGQIQTAQNVSLPEDQDTYNGHRTDKGAAKIQFQVTDPGDYYVHVLSSCYILFIGVNNSYCGGSRGIFLSVDNVVPAEITQKHFDLNTLRTAFDPYAWSKLTVKTSLVNNTTVSKFALTAGSHELILVPRSLGARITKVVLSKDPNFIKNDNSWARARTLVYDLASVQAGLRFVVDVQEFDNSSYLVSKPRFLLPVGMKLKIKNIKAALNANNVSHSWQTIDETITGISGCSAENIKSVMIFGEGDARFTGCFTFMNATTNGGLILTKDLGPSLDQLSFSFEQLEIVP